MGEKCYELTDRFVVPATIDEVWKFFSTAENLPAITPKWLRFTVLTPAPIVLQKDAILDYTIKPMGFTWKWRTKILEWQPPRRFVDLQEKGPYALWHHEHTFEPTDDGVICSDRVLYRLPLGPIGRVMNALITQRQLIGIFKFRRQLIGEKLGGLRPIQSEPQVKSILV